MKKVFVLVLLSMILFTSCSMEPTIPENARTFSQYTEQKELYQECISYFQALGYDAMVSRNDYYSIDGSEKYSGLYVQNMKNGAISACDHKSIQILFQQTDVKLIDWIQRDGLSICAFDMCIPGKNFDYGIYYTSADEAVYFGDPALELTESGKSPFSV